MQYGELLSFVIIQDVEIMRADLGISRVHSPFFWFRSP